MGASEVGKSPALGGFLSKILGAGVKQTVDSIGNAIDKINTSDEKVALQLKYKEFLMNIEGACIDYESKLLESRSKIIETESKGESWLQRNWRPMLMCICMFIVFNNYVLVPYFICPSQPWMTTSGRSWIWALMGMSWAGRISENLGPVLYNVKRKK